MAIRAGICLLVVAAWAIVGSLALASRMPELRIGVYSQSRGPGAARAGASITAVTHRLGRPSRRAPASTGTSTQHSSSGSSSSTTVAVYPTLPASAPILRNPAPRGPTTFWYPDGTGHTCVYVPVGSSLCYTLTGPGSAAVQPALDPAQLAASVSTRIDLSAGELRASPSSAGVTGAPSWFWLEPAPTGHNETATLAGESVTVEASPTVEWRFGDGATLAGGQGEPYQPGTPPEGAITHSYDTRCLPGDQGRDPLVLPSCGSGGYQVTAIVSWTFSYQATGAINATGTLPTRATETTMTYPVTEVRAFLTGSGR